METERPSLQVVVAGHVDHGKSTLIGRLLADTGSLPQGKVERIKAFCVGKSRPFEYAFLLDALKDEQAQGITIDSARIFFKTARRDYMLVDAPGHVEFIKNMVSGAAQASAALLVIDAREGVRENSRRHGYLLSLLGIRQIAVLVNKMDLVGYEESAFRAVAGEYGSFLRSIDVKASDFIAVSGYHGDNLVARSKNMAWYRGKTVLGALDRFTGEPAPLDRPFRMPVQDVYKFPDRLDGRRIVAGTIESGFVSRGDKVVFHPSGKSSRIRAIEGFPRGVSRRASAGMAVGFTLTEQIYLRRGEVAALEKQRPPHVATRLRARLFWLGRLPLIPGKDYVLKLGTARASARLESVQRVLDASTLEIQRGREQVRRHEAAECTFSLGSRLALDPAERNSGLARFVLIDDHEISGGGLVLEVLADREFWIREKVLLRNAKWQKSFIPAQRREARYRQKAALVLITGERDSNRKEFAKALEARLFEEGRSVYFLGIGSVLYGVGSDLRETAGKHLEDVRRLAEIAHIILDSGQLLILSAAEFNQDDLNVLETAIGRERIETVWVGKKEAAGFPCGGYLGGRNVEKAVDSIKSRLRARGFIP